MGNCVVPGDLHSLTMFEELLKCSVCFEYMNRPIYQVRLFFPFSFLVVVGCWEGFGFFIFFFLRCTDTKLKLWIGLKIFRWFYLLHFFFGWVGLNWIWFLPLNLYCQLGFRTAFPYPWPLGPVVIDWQYWFSSLPSSLVVKKEERF